MRTVFVQGKKIIVQDEKSWGVVVKEVKKILLPGMILTLQGPLGAGKTTFVQAFAKDVGIEKNIVSPTFSLMRSYILPKRVKGIKRIIHVDAYRIENEKDMLALDLSEELADNMSILFIEWPENISRWVSQYAGLVLCIEIML